MYLEKHSLGERDIFVFADNKITANIYKQYIESAIFIEIIFIVFVVIVTTTRSKKTLK